MTLPHSTPKGQSPTVSCNNKEPKRTHCKTCALSKCHQVVGEDAQGPPTSRFGFISWETWSHYVASGWRGALFSCLSFPSTGILSVSQLTDSSHRLIFLFSHLGLAQAGRELLALLLRLHVCTTTADLHTAGGNQAQGFVNVEQTLYQLSSIPSLVWELKPMLGKCSTTEHISLATDSVT